MPLSEPSWWYSPEPGLAPQLLSPFASIYGWVASRRMARTAGYRSRLPVVCVGNLTAGGTGKTPLSLRLASELKMLGASPVLLTRGYGGREAGPIWVDRSLHTAQDVGDEALLLAAAAPTVVSRRRDLGARFIEAQAAENTVIVMDDGLQNPQLRKDLAIAVIDGARGIGNGRVIPAGPLRAPAACQLHLIDALVVNGANAGSSSSANNAGCLDLPPDVPVLHARPEPVGDVGWLNGARVVAFAGIANPQRFFSLVERLGATRVETRVFNDHQPISGPAAQELLDLAAANKAQLVTTAKDMARLSSRETRALAVAARCLEIRLEFNREDLSVLHGLLAAILSPSPTQVTPARL